MHLWSRSSSSVHLAIGFLHFCCCRKRNICFYVRQVSHSLQRLFLLDYHYMSYYLQFVTCRIIFFNFVDIVLMSSLALSSPSGLYTVMFTPCFHVSQYQLMFKNKLNYEELWQKGKSRHTVCVCATVRLLFT